jgi:hypothetical protein
MKVTHKEIAAAKKKMAKHYRKHGHARTDCCARNLLRVLWNMFGKSAIWDDLCALLVSEIVLYTRGQQEKRQEIRFEAYNGTMGIQVVNPKLKEVAFEHPPGKEYEALLEILIHKYELIEKLSAYPSERAMVQYASQPPVPQPGQPNTAYNPVHIQLNTANKQLNKANKQLNTANGHLHTANGHLHTARTELGETKGQLRTTHNNLEMATTQLRVAIDERTNLEAFAKALSKWKPAISGAAKKLGFSIEMGSTKLPMACRDSGRGYYLVLGGKPDEVHVAEGVTALLTKLS